jgi:hypothetical protein
VYTTDGELPKVQQEENDELAQSISTATVRTTRKLGPGRTTVAVDAKHIRREPQLGREARHERQCDVIVDTCGQGGQ